MAHLVGETTKCQPQVYDVIPQTKCLEQANPFIVLQERLLVHGGHTLNFNWSRDMLVSYLTPVSDLDLAPLTINSWFLHQLDTSILGIVLARDPPSRYFGRVFGYLDGYFVG